jgi:adenine-specific DNA-methyltransferase
MADSIFDVSQLGQVFTPPAVVSAMLALRQNAGRVLEPSAGDGAFASRLPGCVAIELDGRHAPPGALHLDFFAYPDTEKFDSILGNPPYVRFQDIGADTRKWLAVARLLKLFDARTNLYLFFIEKCIRHLASGGELIFITPRDFLKSTNAVGMNTRLFEAGSITHAIELGDAKVFEGALPNCLIWRFEKGNFSRQTRYAEIGVGDDLEAALAKPQWETRHFVEAQGHLLFTRGDYPLHLSQVATVKVGAVSGADEIYSDPIHGNREFVCSSTVATGKTRRMIWIEPDEPPPRVLFLHKDRLISRGIRPFTEENWWHWGRGYPQTDAPRVYVNGRTRRESPFFLHPCMNFDGALLAIFPRRRDVDLKAFRDGLNAVAWSDLGFVCDGRFLFTQRSLENTPLPAAFRRFLPDKAIL